LKAAEETAVEVVLAVDGVKSVKNSTLIV